MSFSTVSVYRQSGFRWFFSSYVDGILLVVEADRTPRRLVQKAVSMLAPEKLLGLVYNKARITPQSQAGVKDSMYEKFFGFLRKPFEIVPNPDVLYLTDKHQTALTYLEYGLRGERLHSSDRRYQTKPPSSGASCAAWINPWTWRSSSTPSFLLELLEMVVTRFRADRCPAQQECQPGAASPFFDREIRSWSQGSSIVDEAQNLSIEVLEEVRMLSNLQSDDRMLLPDHAGWPARAARHPGQAEFGPVGPTDCGRLSSWPSGPG